MSDVPLGAPLDWDDDQIEKLAEVSESDREASELWWKRHAPKAAKDLLDAEPETTLEVEP